MHLSESIGHVTSGNTQGVLNTVFASGKKRKALGINRYIDMAYL